MNIFTDLADYRFLQNALVAALLSGVACGLVGAWVVARRGVMVSGGVTHASFGGIGLAWFLGWDPILGAAIFALLAALGIEWAASRWRVREDSAIGMVWSVGMALGIIFIALTPGYAPNLTAILFGNILTVTRADLVAGAALAAVTVAVFGLWTRPLMYVAFDAEYARSQGVPTRTVGYAMAALTALVMVLSIRAVGVVLLISLLTFPPAIINSVTRSFPKMAAWSAVVATAGLVAGLAASAAWNIPTGAATIFVLTIALIAVKVVTLPINKRSARR